LREIKVMKINIDESGNSKIAIVNSDNLLIVDIQSALDLMSEIMYIHGCNKMIISKSSITEGFFDLKTRLAGEILQKYTNYHMRIAIIGNFEGYSSKSLRDFIYESNKGNNVFFMPTVEMALDRMGTIL
jgi:Domain of unknown function (DUF4180)